jgi:hypothetical protein
MECIRGLLFPNTTVSLHTMQAIVDELARILRNLYNGEPFSLMKRARILYLHARFVFLQRRIRGECIPYQEDVRLAQIVSEFRSAIVCLHIVSRNTRKRREGKHRLSEQLLL